MGIKEAIGKIMSGRSLDMDEASAVMQEVVEGTATPSQIAAFVVALRMKGETAEEVAGLARVMRQEAVAVDVSREVVDTCGTGGDGLGTFNISTVSAFVVSGAGVPVAKHGNRAYTSSCGSADVLEALGVAIDLSAKEVALCVEEVGIGFMFAPAYHPAMKAAAGPRKEIGVRTVFNILGPLTNPARAATQLLGVASVDQVSMMGEVLKLLGSQRALVVHGEDGTDEVSLSGPTNVCEVSNGQSRCYDIQPEDFGFARSPLSSLQGGSAAENARIATAVLEGETGPRRDVVLLNAGAAIFASGNSPTIGTGVNMARVSIDSGAALANMERLRSLSCSLQGARAGHVS